MKKLVKGNIALPISCVFRIQIYHSLSLCSGKAVRYVRPRWTGINQMYQYRSVKKKFSNNIWWFILFQSTPFVE